MHPVVTPEWLVARLDDPSLRIVDCRFTLDDPDAGRRAYLGGHIPSASFIDVARDLSAPPAGPDGGRHPLPSPDAFSAAARRTGINVSSTVVAYDQQGEGGAARLWWLLRHHGHEQVAVLAGGLRAWSGRLVPGEEDVAEGDFISELVPRDDTVTAEEIAAGLDAAERLLLDARVPARYSGETEPIDPVAGHIPGAINVPYDQPAAIDPSLLADERELVAYCGSGVTATVVLLKLAARGRVDAKLYPGSWSEWSSRGLPAETGD